MYGALSSTSQDNTGTVKQFATRKTIQQSDVLTRLGKIVRAIGNTLSIERKENCRSYSVCEKYRVDKCFFLLWRIDMVEDFVSPDLQKVKAAQCRRLGVDSWLSLWQSRDSLISYGYERRSYGTWRNGREFRVERVRMTLESGESFVNFLIQDKSWTAFFLSSNRRA